MGKYNLSLKKGGVARKIMIKNFKLVKTFQPMDSEIITNFKQNKYNSSHVRTRCGVKMLKTKH